MQENATQLININELSRRISVPKGTRTLAAFRPPGHDLQDVIQSMPHSTTMGSTGKG
jgi:hypothetical protein